MDELTALHDAMTQTLTPCFPEVINLQAFPDLRDGFDLPALFFGLTGFTPGEDRGTGKTTLKCAFQAAILTDPLEPHSELQAMWLAARLASKLRGQYWDLEFVQPAEGITAEADNSNPDLVAFTAWGVKWTQDVDVGDEAEWPWPDTVSTPVGVLKPGQVEVDVELEQP